MKSTIGILGGMGPRATVQFEQLLLERFPGNDQDLPPIITINDGTIPDRTDFILGKGADPQPQIQHNLELLESVGVDIICMPCNTACAPAIFNRLKANGSRLINLPLQTVQSMHQRGIKSTYILATPGTIVANTYQGLCEQAGIKYVLPSIECQRMVTALIRAVKKADKAGASHLAVNIASFVESSECESVILGCTELPLVADELVPSGCIAVDTLAILADVCVKYSQALEKQYETRPAYT